MTLPRTAHLQVHSHTEVVPGASAWFASLYQPITALSKDSRMECTTAFYEALTNAIKHGHKSLPPETPIDIEVTLTDNSITIRIWDRGEGFDVQQAYDWEPDLWDEKGRGIYMIKNCTDFISYSMGYDRDGNRRNCLTIIKYY